MPEELVEMRESINQVIDLARKIDAPLLVYLLEMASLELAGMETQQARKVEQTDNRTR